MTRYGRLSTPDSTGARVVIEILEAEDLGKTLHPDLAAQFMSVPNAAVPGSKKTGSTWTHPDPVEDEEPPAPPLATAKTQIGIPHFKMRFTPEERVAIKQAAGTNPFVEDWLSLTDDPRLEYVVIGDPNLTAAINMLVAAGLLTEERATAILS